MTKLSKTVVERLVREYWKKQATPKQAKLILPSARAEQKLATDWLRSTGFDFKKLKALRAQQRAELKRLAPKAAADAARRWAGPARRAQASASAWAANMMVTAGGSPATNSFFIATPISILASDPKILKTSHVEQGNSFAKVLVSRSSSDVDTVSFIFAFRNPAATAALFNFDTLLNVSGHMQIHADAGFINAGVVTVDAKLDVLTATQVTDTQNVTTLAVIGDGAPFFGGESNSRTLALTRFLTAPGIVVQSDEIVVLLVSLVVSSDLDDSQTTADFNSGDFRVFCPVLFVAGSPLPMKAASLGSAVLNG